VSKVGTSTRACASPAANSARPSASLASEAKSKRPLSAWTKPLRMCSWGAEDPERGAGDLEVGRVLEAHGGARVGLDRGALGQPTDPRRTPAVEAEHRLPCDAAGARDRQAARLVEQRAQLGVAGLRLPQPVGAPEGAEPLDLDPLAGVVLPHELAAGERQPLPVAQQPAAGPPRAVALQREEGERGARGGEQAAGGERAGVVEDGAELAAARAVQLPQRLLRVVVGLVPRVVGGLVDGAGGEQRVEGRGHGRGRLRGGRQQDRERDREQGDGRAAHGPELRTHSSLLRLPWTSADS
jgi:hypothetical protein